MNIVGICRGKSNTRKEGNQIMEGEGGNQEIERKGNKEIVKDAVHISMINSHSGHGTLNFTSR